MSTNKLKYVIVEDKATGQELAILFREMLIHREVAFFFERNALVVSGGFYQVDGGKVTTYGKSESLSKNSRPEDAILIAAVLGVETRTSPKQFTCDEKLGERCKVQCELCKTGYKETYLDV